MENRVISSCYPLRNGRVNWSHPTPNGVSIGRIAGEAQNHGAEATDPLEISQ